ncbi:TIGR02452 family protein [Rhizocola hellebori]|uniref:TIGR02452 family protein n=1 Tax=Rhizocola hellebori TaxID=1392758 RepID=A0A8J3Q9F8_9ACTN|nr:TIGR02452 family protein [Rhizocola hellebori]GIH06524.1 TIGR02452 family protein [Rhizocola hellebori]
MRARLQAIAEETVAVVQAGRYQHRQAGTVEVPGVAQAVTGTRLYLPEEPLTAPGEVNAAPLIEVTRESTLAAAQRMGPAAAALVFASARKPGGGFLTGAQAQEESVARSSALYACLSQAHEFYAFHRNNPDLRYSDRVIYSPNVPVIRDDAGNLIAEPFCTSFLTAAAPNLGAIELNQPEFAASVPEVLQRRCARVLRVAAAHGHRRLVLGAWGCGVFRNDPATVAHAFAAALAAVNTFDHIVFAIYEPSPQSATYAAFAERFAS